MELADALGAPANAKSPTRATNENARRTMSQHASELSKPRAAVSRLNLLKELLRFNRQFLGGLAFVCLQTNYM